MSRCRCCDKPFNDHEIMARNPYTGKPEDMCRRCLNSIRTVDEPDDTEDLPDIVIPKKTLDNPSDMW